MLSSHFHKFASRLPPKLIFQQSVLIIIPCISAKSEKNELIHASVVGRWGRAVSSFAAGRSKLK